MKKILSMVLTLSIVLGTIGVPVFAEEVTASAKIGDESYATLSDALSAASRVSDEVVVEIYDKVTLNESLSGNYTSIKFVGKDTDAEIYLDVQGYITAPGKTVAFEDLKLSKSEGGFVTNAGFMNLAFGVYDVNSVSYKNCVFLNGACASSGEVTFTGCTFYRSHDRYGLWAYGDVDCTVDGCTFADFRGIKMYAEGLEKTVELTVKNTDFSAVNNKPAIVLTCGESVTLENNTYSNTGVFELDLDGAPNGTSVESDVAPTCVNDKGACGVLVDGKIYTTVEQAAEVATSGSTVTLLHNSAETVELPEGVNLNKNGFESAGVTVKGGAGLSGSGTEQDPYLINNLEDLKWFRDDVNDVQADGSNQYTGKYIKLTADIDLGDEEWTPIGVYDSSKDHINFCGIFDGDGHTISNLKINSSNRAGFFGELGKSTDFGGVTTIKNITFENANVSSTSGYVGVVASNPFCVTFDNVCVKGDINVQGGSYTAVIAGHGYANFNNCSVDGGENKGKVVSTGWAVGGIAGHIGDFGSVFTNCTVKNLVVESSICGAAAIAGYGASFKKSSNLYAENVDIVAKSEYYPGCNGYLFGLYGAGDNYDVIKNSSVENCTLLEGGQAVAVYDMAAAIDTTLYTELQAAVDAAVDGDTITLLCNVTQTDGVIITDKKLTIDLNGKTFAVTVGTSTNSRNFLINGSSVATIKNGTMEAKGDYSSGAYGTVRTEGAAYVTLKDLTLYNYRGNGLNIKACSGTKVDISDTVVYSQYGGGIEAAGGEIELTNVTVDQKGMYTAPYNSMAISVNGGGKVTVNSGIYSTLPLTAEEANNQGSSHGSWAAGVLNSGGTLIINGGTFANGNYGDDSLATAARGLILRDTHGVVEINGGTFNALGKIIDYQNNLGDATGNELITIKGGTFNAHPLANTYEQYVKIPEGYAAIENLSGKYVVGVAPTATVIDHGPTVIPADEHSVYDFATGKYNSKGTEDMPLNFVVQFIADESAQAGAVSPYADWYADFVLTFDGLEDGSFNTEGCYLAGYYGDFGWVKIDISKAVPTVEKGVHYPVMLGVGLGQKYDYICSGVKDFKCAMYLTPEVLEANPNLKVNLDLVMVDNSQGQNEAYRTLVNGTGYLVVNNEYEAEDFVAKKELFEITLASVTFGNNLDMSFAIPKNSLADWTGHYVEIVKEYADGRDNVIKTVPYEELRENGNFYVVTFNGIAAKEMTDNLYVTVYDTDGKPVSKTREDSIRAYADRVYASQSDSLKTIIADMLNYGAAAQDYFNDYNITKLANADFDTEFVTKEDPTVVNSLNASNDNFVGSSIVLSSNIDYRMAFKKSMGDITKATIEFTNHYDKPVSYELTKDNIIEEGDFYIVIIDKVVVADARQLITVKLYNGDTELVSVVDSIESYARRMQDRNDPFTPTIMEFMKFADAADAYFDSLN